ncbi:alpha/beta hydrolase [Aquihabitans sp. McL0605]|uniref:alpha/beta hydrolase n=1 Tax=Aquihabitans sp. McL0605 TaxID=3415671 RepID=UPI003CF800D8
MAERIELWDDQPEGPGSTPFQLPPEFGGHAALRNVVRPSLTSFAPAEPGADTAVIVCPGGAMLMLSVGNEGTPVAEWFAGRGAHAYLLEYRTLPTESDQDLRDQAMAMLADRAAAAEALAVQARLAGADAAAAVRWARQRHRHVVLIGFSAGSAAAVEATIGDPGARPDATVAMYLPTLPVPDATDAPPLFVGASIDDPLGISGSLALLDAWRGADRPVELHLFEGGGHGYGAVPTGTTADSWLGLATRWIEAHGLLDPG